MKMIQTFQIYTLKLEGRKDNQGEREKNKMDLKEKSKTESEE